MTDLDTPTATPPRWVRCPIEIDDKGTTCDAYIRNLRPDRAAHIRTHDTEDRLTAIEERIALISQSLRFLGSEIDGIRTDLTSKGVTPTPEESVGEWPDSDFEDTNTEPVATEADLEPPFAELTADTTTDAADLHDITSTDDDLEQRIANLTPPVLNVHTQPGIA